MNKKMFVAPAAAIALLATGGLAEADQLRTTPVDAATDDDGDDDDGGGRLGLLGLVGLAGLAGLAGLRRRDNPVRYDDRVTR